MKTYSDLLARILQRGVHEQLGPAGEGWAIEQNPHELATFLTRMVELGVQSVLEIGTGYKAGLARFLAHDLGWRVVSVDIQDYKHTCENGLTFMILQPGNKLVSKQYKKDFTSSLENLQNFRFDLVFIDGAHDYTSVQYDYETYGPLARKAIAFHDVAGLRDCEGARDFWRELASGLPYDAFSLKPGHYEVADRSSQRVGIGWIELE